MYIPNNKLWINSYKTPRFYSMPILPFLFTLLAIVLLKSMLFFLIGLVACILTWISSNNNYSSTLIVRRFMFRLMSVNFKLKRIF